MKPRDESPALAKQNSQPGSAGLDSKPKLFKGSSTNPFQKRTGSGAGPSIGGAGRAEAAKPTDNGLFYPNANQPASNVPRDN